ncbi:MAG: prepilin-type cleavage/methylation domain-containing protein [Pseudomonadota bacterium]
MQSSTHLQKGLSLIEMAIILAIIAVLVASLLGPLAMQEEVRRVKETARRMDIIKEALLGYAMTNGRLPCPATLSATNPNDGQEDPLGGGVCTVSDGFVPAVTLGITPTDSQGYALDAWQNTLRYRISTTFSSALTTPPGSGSIADVGMNVVASSSTLLSVCDNSTGITSSSCGASNATLTSTAPVVIYSLGPNRDGTGASTDEQENLDADVFFVSHPPTDSGSTAGEFDDVISWLSINILFNRMVLADQLP